MHNINTEKMATTEFKANVVDLTYHLFNKYSNWA